MVGPSLLQSGQRVTEAVSLSLFCSLTFGATPTQGLIGCRLAQSH